MKKIMLMCWVFCLLLLASCASNKEYARIIPDRSVQNDYKKFIMPEGYVYYYSGPEGNPTALVGIREDYQMRSAYWHETNLTKERMAQIWDTIRDEWFLFGSASREIGVSSNGYRIMTKDGEKVGLLFSRYKRVVATFPEPKVITLSVPFKSQNIFRYDD